MLRPFFFTLKRTFSDFVQKYTTSGNWKSSHKEDDKPYSLPGSGEVPDPAFFWPDPDPNPYYLFIWKIAYIPSKYGSILKISKWFCCLLSHSYIQGFLSTDFFDNNKNRIRSFLSVGHGPGSRESMSGLLKSRSAGAISYVECWDFKKNICVLFSLHGNVH